MITLNEKLITARKKLGFTLKQMGEELGVSLGTVHKYESGSRIPSHVVARRYFELAPDVIRADDFILLAARQADCQSTQPTKGRKNG